MLMSVALLVWVMFVALQAKSLDETTHSGCRQRSTTARHGKSQSGGLNMPEEEQMAGIRSPCCSADCCRQFETVRRGLKHNNHSQQSGNQSNYVSHYLPLSDIF